MLVIKASFILILFWAFYKSLLQSESYYTMNRFFLLSGLFFAFALPQLHLPEISDEQGILDRSIHELVHDTRSNNIQVLTPSLSPNVSHPSENGNRSGKSFPWRSYVFGIYVFGVIVLSINLLLQLNAIRKDIRNNKDKIRDTDGTIFFLEKDQEPCSFFRYIFINPSKYDPATYNQVLAHERIHVQKWHSIDLLLSEITVIILWFNPFVWLYRKDIEKNIEFETDHSILNENKFNTQSYQRNLLQVAVARRPLVLTTNYNQSLLKERIMKMNAKKSHGYNYWKYLFMLPLLVGLTVLLNQPAVYAQEQASTTEADSPCGKLLTAVRANNVDEVKTILPDAHPDCSYREDGEPRSPLVAAARNGNVEIGLLLLNAGASVEYNSRGDESPLMAASGYGHLEFTKMLLRHGAEVDRTVKGDGTALINAVRGKRIEVAKVLLEAGADPYLNVPGDEYAMYHARSNNDTDMVNLLQQYTQSK